jgi:hypothetical protein
VISHLLSTITEKKRSEHKGKRTIGEGKGRAGEGKILFNESAPGNCINSLFVIYDPTILKIQKKKKKVHIDISKYFYNILIFTVIFNTRFSYSALEINIYIYIYIYIILTKIM